MDAILHYTLLFALLSKDMSVIVLKAKEKNIKTSLHSILQPVLTQLLSILSWGNNLS